MKRRIYVRKDYHGFGSTADLLGEVGEVFLDALIDVTIWAWKKLRKPRRPPREKKENENARD